MTRWLKNEWIKEIKKERKEGGNEWMNGLSRLKIDMLKRPLNLHFWIGNSSK